MIAVLLCVAIVHGAYPFLAVTIRSGGKLLVVDGWMPTQLVEQVAETFRTGGFEDLVLARGIYKSENPYESGEFAAKHIANRLTEMGVSRDHLHIVFFDAAPTERTYQAALAVKDWAGRQQKPIAALDVATLGVHARRSRLLYQKAFGRSASIGCVSVQDDTYDPAHWWRSSAGVREVPFELLAYVHARFFFSPRGSE